MFQSFPTPTFPFAQSYHATEAYKLRNAKKEKKSHLDVNEGVLHVAALREEHVVPLAAATNTV